MSTTTLNGLLEYLQATLTPNNMQWLGEHLIEYAHKNQDNAKSTPYTIEELYNMAETGRKQIARGKCILTEDLLQKCVKETAQVEEV